ncbi:unnamed protein product [Urochloa decumbens]|uniref:Uncharacterized protein n=1 Tax=Urochloa decumbens TaxID=240449 RepID=A0ABC9BXB5_9POAL
MAAYKNSDGYGSALLSSGTTAHRRIDDEEAARSLYRDARTAAPAPTNKNNGGAPYVFSGERAATKNKDDAAAVEPAAAYYNYNSGVVAGEAFPLVSKVLCDNKTSLPGVAVGEGRKGAGAFTERLRRGLPVIGISAASLAVAGLAAGEPTPAAAFGLFLMLIAGLSAVTIRALRD